MALRALLVLLAVLVALVVVSVRGGGSSAVATDCTVAGSDLRVSAEVAANAATIAAVARSRGLPPRATVIALATAQQESRIRNLDHGDRDSLGLFQQRPSQGWGSEAQVQDPVYATGKFLDGLVEVPGWETGRLTEVAQAVQRSGFPEAYQQWEPMATALAGALLSDQPGRLTCTYRPDDVADSIDPRTAAVAEALRREAGPAEPHLGGTITVPGEGWPAASWAVAHASRLQLASVRYAGWEWTAESGWAESSGDPGVLTVQLPL
ncbi:hypothetical protein GCU67_12645 [Modestobacter muralis]|uniref:Heavy metal transporter n=1 Tax=Modestobacter muralis TaxID=1608614 RepID=A0A6P0EVX4_9ACTN|nr:hypothetical protein [Modestobacter muralis]NEN51901.1 hypothetical protein [Modestobacter muralis]